MGNASNCCSEPKITKSYDPREHMNENEEEHKKHLAEEKAYLEGLRKLDQCRKKKCSDGVPESFIYEALPRLNMA